MPRPELPPPTEGGKTAAVNYYIQLNELKIEDLKKEIEKLEKLNELLKE